MSSKVLLIGCAGYITAFSQTNDNRYEIILKGLCRFELKSELNLMNGFRRAKVWIYIYFVTHSFEKGHSY